MCCSFWEKCKNSPKTGLGCSTPLSFQRFTGGVGFPPLADALDRQIKRRNKQKSMFPHSYPKRSGGNIVFTKMTAKDNHKISYSHLKKALI